MTRSTEQSCVAKPSFHGRRKVDVRLPGKGISNSHGARPVHLIITMIKWFRTSRLSIKNSLSPWQETGGASRRHPGHHPVCPDQPPIPRRAGANPPLCLSSPLSLPLSLTHTHTHTHTPALRVGANHLFQYLGLVLEVAPESGDQWCKVGVSAKRICSRYEGWWHPIHHLVSQDQSAILGVQVLRNPGPETRNPKP